MINELLMKYKDQQPKIFGDYVERSYPVSAVIAMIEEVQQKCEQCNVSGSLPLDAEQRYYAAKAILDETYTGETKEQIVDRMLRIASGNDR